MAKFADHDAYIAAAPEQHRPLLARLRALLAAALPGAEELIMYDMPGVGFGRTVIVGYAAFSKTCGLYLNAATIAAHADEIAAAGLKASKTGITFSPGKPIPDDLVTRLAQAARQDLGL
jgi:uncharacterized protein YdhG (YjbR/CyaY superfamily)